MLNRLASLGYFCRSRNGLALNFDGFHHETAVLLTVPFLAAVPFLGAHFVNDDLTGFAMAKDLAFDHSSFYIGLSPP
jgi:hypothetical protein